MKSMPINLCVHKQINKGKLDLGGTNPAGDRIGFTNYYMEWNGKPWFGITGEFHFSRYPCGQWEEELAKMRMAGVRIVATYVFWIHHEEEEGRFLWNGDKNLRYFLDLCAKQGMYVFLRIGPFSHGECRNGGLPDWLYGTPVEVRSNDPGYLFYVKRLYGEIARQVSGKLFKDGGPVIMIQLENEHMHAGAPWEFMAKQGDGYISAGKDGEEHIRALKSLALEAGLDAPVYACTAWGGASFLRGETLPMYGGYAFCPWSVNEKNPVQAPTGEYLFQNFHDNASKCLVFDPTYPPEDVPFACCELGGGMACWYQSRFTVPPESVEAATVVRIAGGCNFLGYYIFHDGLNPVGKHGYMNENVTPKITYSFHAPLGEYGQIRESCRSLKLIFYFLNEFQEALGPMGTALPAGASGLAPGDTEAVRFAARVKNGSGFLFLNNYQDHVEMKDHHGVQFQLRLPDETIMVPQDKGLTIQKGVSAILPFNLDIGGVLVKYATAQLITSIADGGARTWFFYAPDGMECEYLVEVPESTNIEIEHGSMQRSGRQALISVSPGKECLITFTLADGTSSRICTLSRKEALGLWKARVWGEERVILSDAGVIAEDGFIQTIQDGDPNVLLYAYPAVGADLKTRHGLMKRGKCGIFESFEAAMPARGIQLEIRNIEPGKAVAKVRADSLEDVDEILLQIDYRGDIANAFVEGKLISDNFSNGELWEIGLRRFFPGIAEKEIYIQVTPCRRGKVLVTESAMALKQEFVGEQIAEILSAKAMPRYKAMIMKE